MKSVDIIYRYKVHDTLRKPQPGDSDAAWLRLNSGNRDFATLLDHIEDESRVTQHIIPVDPRDLGIDAGGAATLKQRPFAAVLGCSDARVPIELIFSEGPNDLFVIRVAGNGLGTEVLGSLRYAVEHLGGTLKLIVVLGHSACGAITTAVDMFLSPGEYLGLATKHALRGILDRSLVVVQACANMLVSVFGSDAPRKPGYRLALIEASVITNAALAAFSIQQELETTALTGIRAVYGVYLLETREVWAPRLNDANGIGLAAAPSDRAGFIELGEAVVRSDRISSYFR